MEFPIISALLGAFLIIFQQALMIAVGLHRTQVKLGVGMGEDLELERKVRRHGNLAENAALFLVVLALAELCGASTSVLEGFALFFVVTRLSHALGFMHLDGAHGNLDGNKMFVVFRVLGATGTGWGGIALGGYLTYFLLMS